MTDLVSQLVGALNRLYVAAPTGLECNSFHHSKGEFHSHSEPCKPAAEYVEALAQARAALTAAKAGGWVLPEGKRVIVVDDSFDQLIYWVGRTVSKGNANSDIQEAYEAWTGWDTWPLPTPPKEQA